MQERGVRILNSGVRRPKEEGLAVGAEAWMDRNSVEPEREREAWRNTYVRTLTAITDSAASATPELLQLLPSEKSAPKNGHLKNDCRLDPDEQ